MRDVDRRQLERSIEQLRASPDGAVTHGEYQLRHVNGRRCWFAARETVFSRARDGSVDRILGVLLEITEVREAADRALQLSHEAALVEERERRRLATALHDGPGQLLPLARTKLHLLAGQTDPFRREALIADIDALLRDTSRELAGLTQALRPPAVREVGLGPALRALVVEIGQRHGIRVLVEGEPEAPLPPALGEALVRAVRELLMNVVRHADVAKARIAVSEHDGCLEVVVEDHGTGFDSARMRAGGSGLRGIREQLGYLGGEIEVHSEPGRGTRVRLRAPLALASRRLPEVDS
jgi:signal transduction histidine kinase